MKTCLPSPPVIVYKTKSTVIIIKITYIQFLVIVNEIMSNEPLGGLTGPLWTFGTERPASGCRRALPLGAPQPQPSARALHLRGMAQVRLLVVASVALPPAQVWNIPLRSVRVGGSGFYMKRE